LRQCASCASSLWNWQLERRKQDQPGAGRAGQETGTEDKAMSVTANVKRGPQSWAYIYVALGFVLSIEGTAIGMITPLAFPWNLVTYAVLGSITFWLFIGNGWFQNKLLGLKNQYEEKAR
jgi:hypothetical protein